MSISIEEAIPKLTKIVESRPVCWDSFDDILSEIENINVINDDKDETVLTEFLFAADFFKSGQDMPTAIQHFLNAGYDVLANDGRNGVLPLQDLCWTSYDKYVVDAAKVLLDAGSPTSYELDDDEGNVLSTIGWKSSGAWVVDKDYEWANILIAYQNLIENYNRCLEYHGISVYHDCIGKALSGIQLCEEGSIIVPKGATATFNNPLVFWFGSLPLIISPYIEFWVDNVKIPDHAVTPAVHEYFNCVIGSTLTSIQYLEQSTCFMEFDNGYRILLRSTEAKKDDEATRIGIAEIQKVEEIHLDSLHISSVRRLGGKVYSGRPSEFSEDSLAFFADEGVFLIYTIECVDGSHCYIDSIRCSPDFAAAYTKMASIPTFDEVKTVISSGELRELNLICGSNCLNIRSDDFIGLSIQLFDCSSDAVVPRSTSFTWISSPIRSR